jgi:hypothetical protein
MSENVFTSSVSIVKTLGFLGLFHGTFDKEEQERSLKSRLKEKFRVGLVLVAIFAVTCRNLMKDGSELSSSILLIKAWEFSLLCGIFFAFFLVCYQAKNNQKFKRFLWEVDDFDKMVRIP